MGELAIPTDAERMSVMAWANTLLDSVRNDIPEPSLPQGEPGMTPISRADALIFRLAQDLVDTRRALELACDALQGNHTTKERDELAERLLKLDLTPLEVEP